MSTSAEDGARLEAQEALLYSARHGELKVVQDLLAARSDGKINFDISCKGRSKSNLGWTPLHLATYFGHKDVVEALLIGGADINAVNDVGDTALHKAAFIGQEELVVILVKYGADINVINGEGKIAKDLSKSQDIHRLLEATEHAEQKDRESKMLTAAKEGNLETINSLLTDSQPPNINCVDAQGNTGLHCAAYRGHAHIAVILLQNGIDSSIRNKSGQLAVDMARDNQMREILNVRPVRQLQRTATRFEGQLLKRSRFLGWKPVWAVLQRGVLVYYSSRGQAAADNGGGSRRERKYLDGARLQAPITEPALLVLNYSDGDCHRLAVPPQATAGDVAVVRQNWITSFNEHIAYSGHYLWAGGRAHEGEPGDGEEEDDSKPLGSMQDALTAATNSLAMLDSQLGECGAIIQAMEKNVQMGNTLHQSAFMRFQHVSATGVRALGALRHGAALVRQARDAADARAAAQHERIRVLEEALAALARQHHELEMSYADEISGANKRSKKKRSSQQLNLLDDRFYDAFEADSDSDTLVTAGLSSPLGALSPWENTPEQSPVSSPNNSPNRTPTNAAPRTYPPASSPTFQVLSTSPDSQRSEESLHTALSPASSCGTLISHGGHVYRNARDDFGITRPSSQWSL